MQIEDIKKRIDDFHSTDIQGIIEEKDKKCSLELDIDSINCLLNELNSVDIKSSILSVRETISRYILNDGKRVLYSVISRYVYDLPAEKYDTLINNVEFLISDCEDRLHEKILNRDLESQTESEGLIEYEIDPEVECLKSEYKLLAKIWDHINLASNQYDSFNTDHVKKQVDQISAPLINELMQIQKNTEEKTQLMQSQMEDRVSRLQNQVISILGIFTAMSFAVFGGINAISGIFQNISSETLPTIIILGSLSGIILISLVYSFVYLMLLVLFRNWNPELKTNISKGNTYKFALGTLAIILIATLCMKYNVFGIKELLLEKGILSR